MNRRIDEARALLAKLQAQYAEGLSRVDYLLRAAVAQDPASLPDAIDVQADYHPKIDVAGLAPYEQPPTAEPTVRRFGEAERVPEHVSEIDEDGRVSEPIDGPIRDAGEPAAQKPKRKKAVA